MKQDFSPEIIRLLEYVILGFYSIVLLNQALRLRSERLAMNQPTGLFSVFGLYCVCVSGFY